MPSEDPPPAARETGTNRDASGQFEARAPLVCAVLGAIIAALFIPPTTDFALDDAWIHLSYAKSLRLGEGMSYNPSDWETGFSSPLWVMLLAVWPLPRDGNPVVTVQMLGALLHAVAAWAGASLVLELGRQRTDDGAVPLSSLTLLGGTLVATTPVLLQGAVSGMEVSLAAALVLGATLAVVSGRPVASATLGALAVLARPEALGYALALGAVLAIFRRARGLPGAASGWALASGAAVGMATWVVYCLAVSGYPFPNTQYVKGVGGGAEGLGYLASEVLPFQVWLLSLTGVILLGLAVLRDARHKRADVGAILLATIATAIAIAMTRPFHVGVQFYESRYFAFLAGLPVALLPLGLVGLRRWIGLLLVLPIAVTTGLVDTRVAAMVAQSSQDTRVLHTDVGRYIATELPPDSIVGVEGAGAPRYHAPRSMQIVDLVGLNDRTGAHLHFDRERKMCHFVRSGLTHLAVPVDWMPLFAPAFDGRIIRQFDDQRYTQVLPPRPLSVVLVEIKEPRPAWVQRCANLGS